MANDILGTRSPNGAVGVRGVADSGELSIFNAGALSGFGLVVSGFNIIAGGQVGVQDVAVAKNSAGESDLLVGNGASMSFTLPGAPATSGQSQVHALVLWKDSTVVSAVNDGLDAVGYQVVSGAAATTGQQDAPTDADIRAAIPQGSTAFVCLLAYVTVSYGDPAVVASRITRYKAAVSMAAGGWGKGSHTPSSWVAFRADGSLNEATRTSAGIPGWNNEGNITQYAIPLPVVYGGTGQTGYSATNLGLSNGVGLSLYKYGQVVIARIIGTLSGTINSSTVFGSIPAAYRPVATITPAVMIGAGSTSIAAGINFESDGDITPALYAVFAANIGDAIRGNGAWISA